MNKPWKRRISMAILRLFRKQVLTGVKELLDKGYGENLITAEQVHQLGKLAERLLQKTDG